jgi:hypothetical protein
MYVIANSLTYSVEFFIAKEIKIVDQPSHDAHPRDVTNDLYATGLDSSFTAQTSSFGCRSETYGRCGQSIHIIWT